MFGPLQEIIMNSKRTKLTDLEKERLIDTYNPEDLIDMLDLDTKELIEYLEEVIVTKLDTLLEDTYGEQQAEEDEG